MADQDARLSPPARIFALFYARLATLTLINMTAYAAQESKALDDVSSALYRHPVTKQHQMPWELRVLVVRLQAIGWGDWRRGVEGYYDLAGQCRAEILKIQTGDMGPNMYRLRRQWTERLDDLGGRLADALVEMGDLQGAARFLEDLGQAVDAAGIEAKQKKAVVNGRLALLYLRIGRVKAAKTCIAPSLSTG